jgi:hypothetical protein
MNDARPKVSYLLAPADYSISPDATMLNSRQFNIYFPKLSFSCHFKSSMEGDKLPFSSPAYS